MTSDFHVNMNEYLPLRDVVFNTLRRAIITGEFAPGERLMEISLANRLGVSRTPVREAIRKLELEGLVIMIPRKGAQVAKITEKSLRDVIEIRCVQRFIKRPDDCGLPYCRVPAACSRSMFCRFPGSKDAENCRAAAAHQRI